MALPISKSFLKFYTKQVQPKPLEKEKRKKKIKTTVNILQQNYITVRLLNKNFFNFIHNERFYSNAYCVDIEENTNLLENK